jgi:hypothetical protein
MKRHIILVSALLALGLTVGAGWAFDDKQRVASKNDGRPQKMGGKVCSAVEIALEKTGRAIEKAKNKTDQGLGIAIDKTSQALERAGKKVQGWFDNKPNASK